MEFSSDTTRVLLMQFATDREVFLFDPLSVRDLDPVLSWLADAEQRKVFHSGHDDARLVARQYGTETRGVADTQVFAAFCGLRYPVGLAALLDSMLGISISKGQQRSDWATRPLSSAQVRYAATDVLHLREILSRFVDTLDGKPQLSWAHEESRRVVEERAGFSHPEAADWRFLDDYRSAPEETLLALRLLDWSRELRLPRINGKKRSARPRDLQHIMEWIATGQPLVAGEHSLPGWLTEAHADTIEAMRRSGPSADEAARLERLPPPGPPREERSRRIGELLQHIERRGEEHGVQPALIATKSAVEDLVRFGEAARSILTRGWREELLHLGAL
jgi:ribonuclease D